jgi:hypothetical protein
MIRQASILALVLSCSGSPADLDIEAGDYRLVAYAGSPIPVRLHELPDRQGQPTGCWLQVSGGDLKVSSAPSAFTFTVHRTNSCTGTTLSETRLTGHIDRAGGRIVFVAPHAEGELRFPVEYTIGRDVVVDYSGTSLTYRPR